MKWTDATKSTISDKDKPDMLLALQVRTVREGFLYREARLYQKR